MLVFLLSLLFALVNGKPQYNYPNPQGGQQVSPVGKPSNGRPSNNAFLITETGGQVSPSSGFSNKQQPEQSVVQQKIGGHIQAQFGRQQQSQFGISYEGQQQIQYGNEPQTAAVAGPGLYGFEQPAAIQKFIYVHVPPPNLEMERMNHIPISSARPEKHYKIIFIKTPTRATPATPVIPLQPTREEKTLVYVLVKKPEHAQEIILPTPEPTHPSKPDVFFIRYKPLKEPGAQQDIYQTYSQIEGLQAGGSHMAVFQGGLQAGGTQKAVIQDGIHMGKMEGKTEKLVSNILTSPASSYNIVQMGVTGQGATRESGLAAHQPYYLPAEQHNSEGLQQYDNLRPVYDEHTYARSIFV